MTNHPANSDQTSRPAESQAGRLRRATPLELFADLVFAAAVGQAATRLTEHPTPTGLRIFALEFALVWWLWVVQAFAADRVDDDSTAHRLLVMASLLPAAGVATALARTPGDGDFLFVISYVLARLGPAALYARAARAEHGHRGAHQTALHRILWIYTTGTAVAACGWLSGLAFSGATRYSLWAAAFSIELALPFLNRSAISRAPRSGAHLAERYGLFTLIVLGESIIGPISQAAHVALSAAAMCALAASLVLSGCLWWTYYRVEEHPAFGGRFWHLELFSLGHLPLSMAISAIGSGSALLIATAARDGAASLTPIAAACLTGATAVFFAVVAALRLPFTGLRREVSAPLIAALLLAILTPLSAHVPAVITVAITSAIAAASIAFTPPRERAHGTVIQQHQPPIESTGS